MSEPMMLSEAVTVGRLKSLTVLFSSGLLEIQTLKSIWPPLITDSKSTFYPQSSNQKSKPKAHSSILTNERTYITKLKAQPPAQVVPMSLTLQS